MAQNKKLLQTGTSIPYVSGGTQYFDIPRWGVLYDLILRIAFTITTAGGAAPSGAYYQTLARIVRGISVIAGGKDYIISAPGETLAALAYLDNKRVATGMDAALPSATSTAYDYVIYLPIKFSSPYAMRPDDTGLNMGTPRIGGVGAQMKITWAQDDCSELFGTPAGAAISDVDCTVMGVYETDPEPTFADGKGARKWLTRTIDQTVVSVSASNTKLPITVDERTGLFVRSLLFETLADSVASDAIFANGEMALKIGGDGFGNMPMGFIKDAMARKTGVAPQTGVYQFDYTLFGSNQTIINTGGNLPANLIAYFDTTKTGTTCQIVMTREGIRPLQAAA
jgi:hypothetical protein